jgi:hypothetical protein
MKLLSALAACVLLTSCASAPERRYWPVLPKESVASKPFEHVLSLGTEMDTIRTQLKLLREAVADLASNAGAYDWSSGDATTAGGLMTVVGELADKVGLRNTGLGVAALAYTSQQRFQFATQRIALRKASASLTCLQQVINQFSDQERELALGAGQPAEVSAATRAPLVAMQAVEHARATLDSDFGSVSAAPPDRAALAEFARRYAESAAPAASAASGVPRGAQPNTYRLKLTKKSAPDDFPAWEVQQALNKAKSFEGELGKCRHE